MAHVRPATPDDVQAMVELHGRVAAEGRWIGTEAPIDAERFTRAFTESIESESALLLVATDDHDVVGLLSLHPVHPGVVGLGMSLDAAHRGRRIGTALVEEAITWARAQPSLHKVELEVWPHNAAARALYRRHGFEEEGLRRREYRRRDGSLWDAIAMGLVLDESSPGSPW